MVPSGMDIIMKIGLNFGWKLICSKYLLTYGATPWRVEYIWGLQWYCELFKPRVISMFAYYESEVGPPTEN